MSISTDKSSVTTSDHNSITTDVDLGYQEVEQAPQTDYSWCSKATYGTTNCNQNIQTTVSI